MNSRVHFKQLLSSANDVTHPELLQIHHQTVVRKTGGKPAEEDNNAELDFKSGDGVVASRWMNRKIFKQENRKIIVQVDRRSDRRVNGTNERINIGLIHGWTGGQAEFSDQTAIRQIEMRLIPLVFTRSYAVSVDRLESISFFMWECKTCITWGSSQPLIGQDTWSHGQTCHREQMRPLMLTCWLAFR